MSEISFIRAREDWNQLQLVMWPFESPEKCYGMSRKKVVTNDFDRAAIRRTVHEFYTRKEYPTVQMLLKAVHQKGIFVGEETSLKHLLKEMGFKFKIHNNRKYVMEQPRIIAQRHIFLRKVCKYRREGQPIIYVYLDETWLNAHHSLTKCWIDNDGTGGLPVKSEKGGRVIILHAGWEHGWIPGACLVFQGKTRTSDYHNEMNIIISFHGVVFNKINSKSSSFFSHSTG